MEVGGDGDFRIDQKEFGGIQEYLAGGGGFQICRRFRQGVSAAIVGKPNVGKSSLSPEMIEGIGQALDKRELIKVGVLKNCMDDPHAIAECIAERTHSMVVKVIGKKIILYKPNAKNPTIVLPK